MFVQRDPHAPRETQLTRLQSLVRLRRAGCPSLGADLALLQAHLPFTPSLSPQPPGSGQRGIRLLPQGALPSRPGRMLCWWLPQSAPYSEPRGRPAFPAGSDGANQGHLGASPCLRASGAVSEFSPLSFFAWPSMTRFALTSGTLGRHEGHGSFWTLPRADVRVKLQI